MAFQRAPWNKGKPVGQKAPLNLSEMWSIRVRLQLTGNGRDLALFNLAIDSKLRGGDLIALRLRDIFPRQRYRRASDHPAEEDGSSGPVRAD